MKTLIWLVTLLLSLFVAASAHSNNQEALKVGKVIDAFHKAAAVGDGETYFNLLTHDAIFLGTDANERWSKEVFKQYALPAFSDGEGWLYTVKERHVSLMAKETVAVFDELLFNDKYGLCRGTGALEKTPQGWKIKQYNLTFTVPNGVASTVIKQIKQYELQQSTSKEP